MGIQITDKQYYLEKYQASRPDAGHSTKPRKNYLGYQRLYLKEQECRKKDRNPVKQNGKAECRGLNSLVFQESTKKATAEKAKSYYVADGKYKTSHGYRLHWILSTQKAERDAETRQRRIERTLTELRKLRPKLKAYKLKRRKQINCVLLTNQPPGIKSTSHLELSYESKTS